MFLNLTVQFTHNLHLSFKINSIIQTKDIGNLKYETELLTTEDDIHGIYTWSNITIHVRVKTSKPKALND